MSQSSMSLLRQILTFVGAILAGRGIGSQAQWSQAISDISVIIPAAISLSSIAWSFYAHFNMVKVPKPDAVAAGLIKILLVAFMLSAFLAVGSPAHAQAKKGFAITGNPIADIKSDIATATGNTVSGAANNIADTLAKPFQDIAKFVGEDADGAIALSTQIATLQDGHGQQCWMAMKAYGDIVKAHPVPLTFHVINDFEALRLLAMATNNLCSNVHCTQVFADATSMAQAASPVPLAIPSLHDLCSKVPQIPVVAPVTPAASSTATPAAK